VGAAAVVGGALVVGAALGLVLMPVLQGRAIGLDAYDAICRAIGIAEGTPALSRPTASSGNYVPSPVRIDVATLANLRGADPKVGEGLMRDQCAACHGEQGISADPQFPHLAGQPAIVVFKQLHDYKSGARQNEVMGPIAQALDDAQIASVAAYVGALTPRVGFLVTPGADVRRLVQNGDPARGLAACGSCHGAGTGGPIEAPLLVGQSAPYLAAQLEAYRSGARANDIMRRMRSVATKLSDSDIRALSAYYATFIR
jgi:cytochrome c553